jgi:hypothetical protein
METAAKLQATGRRVAENVRTLREGTTVRALATRLLALGRPILASGITKVEQGARRVDVDDLVALALALEVTPNRLLLPGTASEERVDLLDEVNSSSKTAWLWASGELDLWDRPTVDRNLDLNRVRQFRQRNRPHDRADVSLDELEQHASVLAELSRAAAKARASGLSMTTIVDYLKVTDAVGRRGEEH